MPLKKKMAVHWSTEFGSTFNNGMTVFVSGAVEALQHFHNNALTCPELGLSTSANLALLSEQLDARVQTLRQVEEKFRSSVKLMQRVGSRMFAQEIAVYMKEIYDQCASIHGMSNQPPPETRCMCVTQSNSKLTGPLGLNSFNRMKEALEDFVDQNRLEILTKSLGNVGSTIIGNGAKFEQQMEQTAAGVVAKIKEDYELAILGRERVLTSSDASPSLRAAQKKVYQMLLEVEDQFANALRGAHLKRAAHPIGERSGGISDELRTGSHQAAQWQ